MSEQTREAGNAERLRDLTAGYSEGVMVLDARARLLLMNPAAERLLGWTEKELREHPNVHEAIHLAEDGRALPLDECSVVKVARSGVPFISEREIFMRKDGERFPVSVIVTPLLDGEGVLGAVMLFRDTSEGRRAAAALKESEGKYRQLVELAQEGIMRIDAAGKATFVNPKMAEMLGYDPQDILGMALGEFVDESSQATLQQQLERRKQGIPDRYELRLLRKDGTLVDVTIAGAPVLDEHGKYVGGIAAVNDISDRKRVEEALRRSEIAQRAIFNSVNDAIFIHDPENGAILDVNRKMTEMYGYTPEEACDLNVAALSANEPPYTAEVAVEKVRAAAAGDPQLFEWRARDRAGRVFWVEVNLKRVTIAGEERVVAVVRDVSERKKADDALKEKDRAIRQAYVEVIGAVTGGKLVLMTPDEIAEAVGEPLTEPRVFTQLGKLSEVRHEIAAASRQAFPGLDPDDFMVAVGEALANALKHAGRGVCRVYREEDHLQVMISDRGPGVDFSVLPKATLVAGFSTKVSLGMGFTIMLELCDRLLLTTQSGETTLVLEIRGR